MVPLNFCTLLMVLLNFFFDYQWYPRVIERLTIIIFFDLFHSKSSKTVTFFTSSFIFYVLN